MVGLAWLSFLAKLVSLCYMLRVSGPLNMLLLYEKRIKKSKGRGEGVLKGGL